MIPYILLPRYFKWIGILLYISGMAIHAIYQPDLLDVTNGLGLLIQVFILSGLLCICCSKEKYEDEYIKYYRLTSLQWAVIVFIALRLFYKTMAWYTNDINWAPHWQVNSMLLMYLIFFYYQLYIKDFFMNLFKKEA
ncbi:MAG: hypothetical protein JNM51_17295 [Bacteroidia bacterium]|nr:hypothetical protein [Bacteroidia bacterium]